MALAAALGSVCVLAVAGVADSAAAGRTSKTVANGPRVVGIITSATRIIGATASERSLLQEILAALTPTHIPLLRVVRVHGGVKLQAPVEALRPTWELLVVGVVFFDRSADEHLPRVLEVDASQVGWPTIDNISPPRPRRATPASVTATRRMMRRLALASGAAVAELTVSAPDGLAVVMRLRVSDAAKFLAHQLRTLVLDAEAHEARYEGLYIEVDDAGGIAWADGETRLGGEHYVRQSLRGCDPFPAPTPSGVVIGPCPR
jgi:hypothetical protein